MKKILYIAATLTFLTACEQKNAPAVKEQSVACFNIISLKGEVPESPILINKCSGETWKLLYTPLPLEKGQKVAGKTYSWYKIDRYDYIANSSAGF